MCSVNHTVLPPIDVSQKGKLFLCPLPSSCYPSPAPPPPLAGPSPTAASGMDAQWSRRMATSCYVPRPTYAVEVMHGTRTALPHRHCVVSALQHPGTASPWTTMSISMGMAGMAFPASTRLRSVREALLRSTMHLSPLFIFSPGRRGAGRGRGRASNRFFQEEGPAVQVCSAPQHPRQLTTRRCPPPPCATPRHLLTSRSFILSALQHEP